MSAKGDAYRIKCPICHAGPGSKCRDPNGHPKRRVHEKRAARVTARYMRAAFTRGKIDHLIARAERSLPLAGQNPPPDLS